MIAEDQDHPVVPVRKEQIAADLEAGSDRLDHQRCTILADLAGPAGVRQALRRPVEEEADRFEGCCLRTG